MFTVWVWVGSLTEEHELLVAIRSMVAEVEEADNDEEDIKRRSCV